ncbi:transglycosylase SLT domain-containing protein [Streptomyces gamaensis]|uniref:Transglycosylase SLT domain-containing protein n=1 Tax=Streptomyces gamaensis TaxID=1763542 RepID=A0ABW0YVB6_9ACTN
MRSTASGHTRLSKVHTVAAAGIAALGAAAVALAVVPTAHAADTQSLGVKTVAAKTDAFGQTQTGELTQRSDAAATDAKAQADAAAQRADATAQKARADKQAASRSTDRAELKAAPAAAAPKQSYGDNLDGWIREALDVMQAKGIPGSYEGIKRNIMRESTGNPQAINDWDVNAVNGVPSKGLLQIIDPTFKAFHVDGTSWDIYDPVANIVASCNYAAKTYGSMDNVNSAY